MTTRRDWGATDHECRARLPGDELVAEPARNTTLAVSIRASAPAVWRWLVQLGQDRGGMYSYDWLENLVGLRIHSTEWIHPEWQHLEPGDLIRLVRPGWLGLRAGYALTVDRVAPGRALVLRDPAWPSVWSFHLVPCGPHSCRLISRGRAPRRSGARAVLEGLMEPVQLVMTRGMLLGIKRRAESVAAVGTYDPALRDERTYPRPVERASV